MQSISIIPKVVSSIPSMARCTQYNPYVMLSVKYVSDLWQISGFLSSSLVFSINKTDPLPIKKIYKNRDTQQ